MDPFHCPRYKGQPEITDRLDLADTDAKKGMFLEWIFRANMKIWLQKLHWVYLIFKMTTQREMKWITVRNLVSVIVLLSEKKNKIEDLV